MWWNRKETVFQQAVEKLEKRFEAAEDLIRKQLADNDRKLLEFADLSNKTRRLYLRLTRLTKIEQEQTSEPITENHESPDVSARDIRESISRELNL